MQTKHCPRCKTVKSIEEFSRNKKRYDNCQSICKLCKKEEDRLWYQINKEKRQVYNKKIIDRNNLYINSIKDKCKLCGYNKCLEALEFHHLTDKLKDISILRRSGSSLKTIKEEISKCILVCANCHREIHGGLHDDIIKNLP